MEVKWTLGGTHCLTGCLEANILLPPVGNLIPYRPARNLVTTLTELPRLCEVQYLVQKQCKLNALSIPKCPSVTAKRKNCSEISKAEPTVMSAD